MVDIPDEEQAKKPVALVILFGVLFGLACYELNHLIIPENPWLAISGILPGIWVLRGYIKRSLRGMNVIESDQDTITGRLISGKLSYSDEYRKQCYLFFIVIFLVITVGLTSLDQFNVLPREQMIFFIHSIFD